MGCAEVCPLAEAETTRQRVVYQGCVVFEGECRCGKCKVLKGLDGMVGRLAKRLLIVDDSLGKW